MVTVNGISVRYVSSNEIYDTYEVTRAGDTSVDYEKRLRNQGHDEESVLSDLTA